MDAGWDGRGEAERRDALLRGLAADFAVAERYLEGSRGAHQAVREASGEWLRLSRSENPPANVVALADTLVSEMQWTLVTRPPTGTLDALLQSGDLSIIDSRDLVSALSTWASSVEYLNDFEKTGADQWYNDVTPYLRGSGIRVADLMWTRRYSPPEYPIEPRPANAYRLLPDPEWESIVQARWFIYDDVLGLERSVREQLDQIQGLLLAELGSIEPDR